jgi:HD-like signal output (HDOD) protein
MQSAPTSRTGAATVVAFPLADAASVSALNALPTYDALASWQERLTEARALQDSDPDSSGNPDVTALLQLLAAGPDTVIRQLPAAARDALSMCDDESLSRIELARRLSRDPALVQGLLRTANSAAFGAGREAVLGIEQSLDRIGVSGARAVVLSSCVDGLLSHPGGEFNAMAGEVWSHMVRTAPLARTVASAFAADPDEAFAIALLHDVGKLVVFDRVSVLRATRRRAITLPTGFMHALLQRVHEPLGAIAALQWGMGARAAAAIGTHHRTAATAGRDALAEAIFLAERADHADRRNEPFDLDALWLSGRLTGSPARAASALQQLSAAA